MFPHLRWKKKEHGGLRGGGLNGLRLKVANITLAPIPLARSQLLGTPVCRDRETCSICVSRRRCEFGEKLVVSASVPYLNYHLIHPSKQCFSYTYQVDSYEIADS